MIQSKADKLNYVFKDLTWDRGGGKHITKRKIKTPINI
jgi:hypothetical protein